MPHKIHGIESRPVQVGSDRSVQRTGGQSTTNAPIAIQPVGRDAVHITGSARQLAALELTLKDQPVVDETRVARTRSAIENGTYQIDGSRIADKLLRLEEMLKQT